MGMSFFPTGMVEVPEIPFSERLELAASSSAIVVVDMQNDFVKPGGSLQVASAMDTVPGLQTLLERARKAGVRIAYTQDSHDEGDPEWQIWPEHCRINTWGWQIIEELAPQEGDVVCPKSRYDGFYGTQLEHVLSRLWKVENLIITGTVSSICVAHTAASAGLRWFRIILAADGMSALTEFDQALTLRQASFLYYGNVVKSTADIRFV